MQHIHASKSGSNDNYVKISCFFHSDFPIIFYLIYCMDKILTSA